MQLAPHWRQISLYYQLDSRFMYDKLIISSLWPHFSLPSTPGVVVHSKGFTVNRRTVKKTTGQIASTAGERRKNKPLSSPPTTTVEASQQHGPYPHTGGCIPMSSSPNLLCKLAFRLSELVALLG